MSTIAEQLTALQAVKSGLKAALTADGADMNDVAFPEYPEKVQAMSERWSSLLNGTITEIDFTGTSEKIREGICYYCRALQKVTIPETITVIKSNAFKGCSTLPNISIPDSVLQIETDAFRYCVKMKLCSLGTGVNSVGANALDIGSADLPATVISKPTVPPSLSSSSAIGAYVSRIVVPYASVTDYTSATNWAVQAGKFETRLALRWEDGALVVDHDILDGDVSAYPYRAERYVPTDAGYKVYYYANDVTTGQEYVDPNGGGYIAFGSNPDRPPTDVWYYNNAWHYSNPNPEYFYEYGGTCSDCGVMVHSDSPVYPACPVCGNVFFP